MKERKNPLIKRLPRELKSDIGKYFVVFVFMVATIGFVSGFLVASGSMKATYNESFEKYNIEDGHFIMENELDRDVLEELEKEEVRIYKDFYLEEEADYDNDGHRNAMLRIFSDRTQVNKICLMEGELPVKDNEIALDRMHADNSSLQVGDVITVGGRELTVTGLVALSDYSALFSDNGDMMFDAVKFGVAIMTKAGFERFGDSNISYDYAWKYSKDYADDTKQKELSDAFMKKVSQSGQVKSYIPRYLNQAINFTGDDMGRDKALMTVLLYVLIVILAFVFAVTINHTVTREATVIGTLRASGYSKKELLVSYIANPIFVTVIAAVLGNILGYTIFKDIAAALYYGSYSLPTYETRWNAEAFVLTTAVPFIIMVVTTVLSILKKLSYSPLQFIRHDFARRKKKTSLKLPNFKFFHRFRLRIIFQNISSYGMLFVGITFANILLLFGLMMRPLLSSYQSNVMDHMLCDYQYILKMPVEVENSQAEKYLAGSLKMDDERGEKITVYGIADGSSYMTETLPDDGILIASGISEKYHVRVGDTLNLKENYGDGVYAFQVKGIIEYPASLAIFMKADGFRDTFELPKEYFNGYFSDEELEIDPRLVSGIMNEEALTKVSRQLDVSMGDMFELVKVFAVVLFILLIYLLTKLVIEKNSAAISMVKILGYSNKEISSLYIVATSWVVMISTVISIFIADRAMVGIYHAFMSEMTGWLTYYVAPHLYFVMFVLGLISYGLVAVLQLRKIKRIPMDEALKNVE